MGAREQLVQTENKHNKSKKKQKKNKKKRRIGETINGRIVDNEQVSRRKNHHQCRTLQLLVKHKEETKEKFIWNKLFHHKSRHQRINYDLSTTLPCCSTTYTSLMKKKKKKN